MNPGSKEGRISYMIKLLQNISDETITRSTEIKGASIEKLCEFAGGGYYRVIRWLESKQKDDADKDLTPLYKECRDLMKSRNEKYGDSWRVLTIQSVANLIEMKMTRIANMKETNLDPKIEDEFIDAVNYAIMGLHKFRNHD